MQRVILDKILKHQLNSDEIIQKEVYELILRIVPRMIEAGTIKKEGHHYRFGADDISESNAIKRIINNISTPLKSLGGYKLGLIDRTEETAALQQEIISSQIKCFLSSGSNAEDNEQLANVIADTILMSWDVVPK